MKRLKLLLIPLLMFGVISCNNESYPNKNNITTSMVFDKVQPFIVDGKNYKWTIDSQDNGKLLIYSVDEVCVKYRIPFEKYKIAYVNNIEKGVAYLFDYEGYHYLLAVGL